MFDAPQSKTKQRVFRVADMFCGAGGTSTGIIRAARDLGAKVELMVINHWPVAIETHKLNHPDAIHYCADIETSKPRELVPGGVLDLLCASPSCTYHSCARGAQPVYDQQRMDPWHVVRWCTDLRVHALVVENVPEFVEWGPCDARTGRRIKSRAGEYFRAWIAALEAIGFRLEWRILCCADYGDGTTRKRFFLIARSDRKPLRWPEPSHGRPRENELLPPAKPWRTAAASIDWTRPGTSIFTRKRPLKHNTIRRILAGAIRYHWPAPHIAALQALLEGRPPVLDISAEAAAPFLIHFRGTTDAHLRAAAHSLDEPLGTITAGGSHMALIMATGSRGRAKPHLMIPVIAPYYGSGSGLSCTSVDNPLPAITTKARFGLAEPFIFPITHAGKRRPHSIHEPPPTVTCAHRGEFALTQPALEVADGYRIDVLYRMLAWRELARASSFDIDGEEYQFAGNITEITKQIGNAVPLETARALGREQLRVRL